MGLCAARGGVFDAIFECGQSDCPISEHAHSPARAATVERLRATYEEMNVKIRTLKNEGCGSRTTFPRFAVAEFRLVP